MKLLTSRRRRGAGMTEYIILVGLIAILLVAAIKRFSVQLDVTVRGSKDGKNGGIVGKVDDLGKDIDKTGGSGTLTSGSVVDASEVTSNDGKTGTHIGSNKPVTKGPDGQWRIN